MDPYVLVEFRGKLFKTNVCQEGGTTPIWNFKLPEDLHLLPPVNVDEEINLRCMEEDFTNDDKIGEATITVGKFLGPDKKGASVWVTMLHQG